jgi:hypothetical protein
VRGLGRLAGRADDAALVGDRLAAAQDLLHEVPHGGETDAQSFEVGAAQTTDFLSLRRHGVDGALDVHGGEIGVNGDFVGLFGGDTAGLAQLCRRGMRVSRRQWFVGEPGIGNEAPGSRRIHDVAAPQSVNAQNRGCGQAIEILLSHEKPPLPSS